MQWLFASMQKRSKYYTCIKISLKFIGWFGFYHGQTPEQIRIQFDMLQYLISSSSQRRFLEQENSLYSVYFCFVSNRPYSLSKSWYLYIKQMVTLNTLRTHEQNQVFRRKKNIQLVTALDLIQCLQQIKKTEIALCVRSSFAVTI